ncbi:putative ribosome biogenesis GTPase RsgA [Bacteroidia bacterium]|nr:putative ribosome biogenesis GTPase RsgA [Bacteroidia bacterium]
MMDSGRIILVTGKNCKVKTDNGDIFDCVIRGVFRLKGIRTTHPVAVGDIVDFQLSEKEDVGVITKIHERKNCIIRKSVNLSHESHLLATNIDNAFLVVSLTEPATPLGFIDRFTVAAQTFHIPLTLIFNKCDLHTPNISQISCQTRKIYEKIGFPCIETSVVSGYNIDLLRNITSGKTILFSGNSGVGKSALINAIDNTKHLKTGEISSFHKKGKHTTTFTEMHRLGNGAYIIDSPGIKEFGLIHLPKNEIHLYFPEFFAIQKECKFDDCTHTHEPDCAVLKALENGEIAESRYKNYVYMLE